MSDRDPIGLWRLLALCLVLGAAFWAAVIWAAITLTPTASGETIRHNLGGDVREYTLRANIAALQGGAVIDGPCASACVMYLQNACLTPRARLGFHSPSGGTASQVQAARETLASHMPDAMARWYLSGPAMSHRAVWLDAGEAVKLGAKECK